MHHRITEPSTWAGFGVLFQVFKAFVPPQYAPVVDGISALAGAIAAALPEKAAK